MDMTKELLDAFFADNSLVQQHLASYNKFIEKKVQLIIDRTGTIQPSIEGFELKFGAVRLEKPMIVEADGSRRTILPMEADRKSVV